MYEEKDYIIRLIHDISRMIVKLMRLKGEDRVEDAAFSKEIAEQYKQLVSLVDCGNINDAENQLLVGIDAGNPLDLQMALLFYQHVIGKTETYLLEHDFSKEEIMDGVTYVMDVYGYGNLIRTIMMEYN